MGLTYSVCNRPTNFLDAETLAVLTHSLRAFKGAVLTVSHHDAFVRVLCNEAWDMDQGKLTVTLLKEKLISKIGAAAKAASSSTKTEATEEEEDDRA
jgi:ATPase subunit of ABC transporter with duplicated ATPase domains